METQRRKTHREPVADGSDLREMRLQFGARIVQRCDRSAGKLELSGWLQRNGSGVLFQADDVVAVHQRLAAERTQSKQQVPDAAGLPVRREVWRRRQVATPESKLFVLGADAEPLLRLTAGLEIFGHLPDRRQRGVVGVSRVGHALLKKWRLP